MYQFTAIRKDNSDASFTLWDKSVLGMDRILAHYGREVANYTVTVRELIPGAASGYLSEHTFDGADYRVDADIEAGICMDCGGPCHSADAIADDSGLAWCGSFYGNGCADAH